jgi:hypothetical protein
MFIPVRIFSILYPGVLKKHWILDFENRNTAYDYESKQSKAVSSKEEARKGRCGRPRPGAEAGAGPEAADRAAGAAGKVG